MAITYSWIGRRVAWLFIFATIGANLAHAEYSIFWSLIPAFLLGFKKKGTGND